MRKAKEVSLDGVLFQLEVERFDDGSVYVSYQAKEISGGKVMLWPVGEELVDPLKEPV